MRMITTMHTNMDTTTRIRTVTTILTDMSMSTDTRTSTTMATAMTTRTITTLKNKQTIQPGGNCRAFFSTQV
jgi:hypothetical protein